MDIRIDKRDNGFRVRWHHNGQQGRELFATALELQSWLSRFDFDAGRPVSVEEEAARSFSVPAEMSAGLADALAPSIFPEITDEERVHFNELERRAQDGEAKEVTAQIAAHTKGGTRKRK